MKSIACQHISQFFTWLRALLSQIGHECILLSFFVWERLRSVLFIHSLRLLHLVNISLAAKESGTTAWLPSDCVSVAYSSAPNRDLAPQIRETGELAESLWFAFLDCQKKRWGRADVTVSNYQYICIFNLFYE